ncbi:hypothetical protein KPZU09_51540 [Klebsiella pneumoniae]|uniref:Alpha/beta hydrolase fold-3 domain-containing protein n=1 Tax=Klebsiella pneumoniae TaxID=573 RepID=A0A919HXV9_KLEPN|nr:hypothetical protein KPZU09_51540 [Klebsiella pneumoniae]
MALEKGIASLVEAFIAAGRPSSRDQHIDDRRAGYIASAVLAGETETRVRVEDITLEGMHFRVVSPPTADGLLPTLIYYHGGCFVSGGFTTHDNQLRQLAMFSGCRVIAVQYRLAPEHTFPAAHDDAEQGVMIIHRHAEQLGVDASRITGWRQRRRAPRSGHGPAPESGGSMATCTAYPDLPDARRYRQHGKLRQQRRGLHHYPGHAA